jgi:REP element-mobilizing transposase RayT
MEYRKGSHTVYDIEHHIVWATKYRYRVLRGKIAHEHGNCCGRDAKRTG